MPSRPATARKRTPTRGVVLLARPKRRPKWWPTANEGWVTLVCDDGRYDGWTVGLDRSHTMARDTVEVAKGDFKNEMRGLKVGGWEFKIES